MIETLWTQGELALASYATLASGSAASDQNQQTLIDAGMSARQDL